MKQQQVPGNMGPLTPRQREITGILLCSLAVFAIVSLYVHTAGWLGYQIQHWLRVIFGQTAVVFCVLLVVFSLHLFKGIYWPIKWRKQAGYLLLLSTITTIYHLSFVYQGYQLPPSLAEEIHYATSGQGAGIFGAVLMVSFLTVFGLPGTYIILASLFLISVILVFDISFLALFRGIYRLSGDGVTNGVRNVFEGFRAQKRRWQDWQEIRKLALIEQNVTVGKRRRLKAKGTLVKPQDKENDVQALDVSRLPVAFHDQSEYQDQDDSADVNSIAEDDLITQVLEPQDKSESHKERRKSSANFSSSEAGEWKLSGTPQANQTFRLPPVYILKKGLAKLRRNSGESKQKLLEDTFASFGISAKVVNICQGPVVTRYELQPAPGIKVNRITGLADDLALALAAADVRIEAPVPGKSVVGIEVPNKETQPVLLREIIEHTTFAENPSKVALALGKDIAGNPVVADLKKWLHLLVAGSTGSGKSVCLNSIIASILYKADPNEVKLLMIDPKRVELAIYDGIPHLISPVVTDPKKAAVALRWAVVEMERRYKLFADTGVRNIDMYTQLPSEDEEGKEREHLPYIVIIVDELADLMMVAASDVEDAICRIAQMARAARMYPVIATQRPSVDVITGLIKANVPSRISFSVSSQVDSRTILDMGGAERLIGKGDMLFYPLGASKPTRAQGAWIADKEVEALVRFWKKQGEPDYQEAVVEPTELVPENSDEDELLEDAIRLVVETGQASISMLQRRFRIGYSRAARLIDMMEVRSIVGPHQGSKARDVLVDSASIER